MRLETTIHRKSWRAPMMLAAALAVTLCLAACDDDFVSPSELMGGEWRLQSMQRVAGPVVIPENPARYTVTFEADGRMAVQADCNSCGGSYSLGKGSLTVSPLVCTLIACPEPTLGQRFVQSLEGTSSVDLDEGGARLTFSSAEDTLRFTR
jgi:heat shock protein HslJ